MPSLINAFREDQYKIGDAQAIIYDRKRVEVFPEGFLASVYLRLKGDRYHNSDGNGVLEALFCGMTDFSFDAIVAYLARLPIVVMGVWNDDEFEPAGIAFPSAFTKLDEEAMAFCGYTLFRKWWGTEEATALGMLGLCAMFGEWKLKVIHGMRYVDNHLTARFIRQYGFRDVGQIERYMLRRGKLAPAIVSSLMVEDFELYLQRALIDHYGHK